MQTRFWFLPLLAGLLMVLAFPHWSIFPLAWVALIPYLVFLQKAVNWRQWIGGHLIFSATYFGGILYWIPSVLASYGQFPWAAALPIFGLMLLGLAAMLLPFTLLFQLTSKKSFRLALLGAPAFWTLTELMRTYFPLNGFPWGSLGYSQLPFSSMAQVADLGGVYLISFLIVSINAVLFDFLVHRKATALALVTGLVVAANLYGIYRLHFWSPSQADELRIGLVQGNLSLSEGREYYARKYFESLPDQFDRAVSEGARFVIFPEAQNPFYFSDDFYFRTFWSSKTQRAGAFLLFNSTYHSDGDFYNSAFVLGPQGDVVYRYDKIHLVPFGEYVPFQTLLSFVEPLVQEVSDFTAGKQLEVGSVAGISIGTLICYEAIFPQHSRTLAENNAGVLVNITNDSWFGLTAAPYQHLQMAAVRAIESRRPILRAANSGFSTVISPKGEILHQSELFETDVIVETISSAEGYSLFVRLGQWPILAIIVTNLVIVLVGNDRRLHGRSR